ncbi:hypothetical protein SBY92_003319 [Candida maltosa Xu316]
MSVKKYTKEDMDAAIAEIKANPEIPKYLVFNNFGIPLSTGFQRLYGRPSKEESDKKKRHFTDDQERQLAEWIIEETLRNKAPRAAEIKSKDFLKEDRKLLVKIQEEYHFEPQDIYNFDETGMTLSRRKNEIVIGPNTEDFTNNKKGVKSLPVVGYADREGCTVIECCSAAGQRLPSYFIFKGTKPCAHWIANQDFAIESNLTSSFSADSTADQSSIPVVDESTETLSSNLSNLSSNLLF